MVKSGSGSGPESAKIGLCADCGNVKRMQSARGSVFYLCQLSAQDPSFSKYPRLPVTRCSGYVPASSCGRPAKAGPPDPEGTT